MLQKKTKRVLSLATALALVCTGISLPDSNVAKAAKKAKLKTKKISLKVGKKKKIAISGKVKKAKYTFKSSKKAVASVSKSGVVTAKKKGNAVITVKEKKKKKTKVIGKVKVTVKAVKAVTPSKPQTKPNTAVSSSSPSQATNAAPTATPLKPTATPTSVPTPTPDPNIFKMEGEQVKPTDADTRATYTLNSDGSVTVEAGWKYYAIAFESPLNLNKVKSITIEGSASAGFRLSFGNKDGEYFIDHENLDSWVYPSAFNDSITIDLTELIPSGKADWLFLGTKSDDEVTFNIKSISFKLGAENLENVNTDGLTEAIKEVGNNNPIAAQRFMADPYAIEYNGRVYVYGTNDSQSMRIGEDGKIPNNNYSNINTLNCYSSADMVNWRDEGIIQVAGKKGPATWSKNSWAPAVCYKNIDGKDKFFIYFADNGSGIGVLEGDSPTGPWRDPIGKQLISRNTPNCGGSEVPWLFDPAVFVDDDGQGYLYFGGIGEAEDREHPKCIRVVKLGDDMISLKEDPVVIDAPAPFEDSGINKFNGKYYYSYCTNWDGAKKRPTTNELGIANIAYMVSDSPMGPWSEAKVVLKNPTSYFTGLPSNDKNNNHHCMLQIGDKIYMFYHSQKLAADLGITQGYRTTGVDLVTMDENGDLTSSMTNEGVSQVGSFNPYDVVEAETFAWSDGTSTIVGPEKNDGRNNRVLSSVDKGDYVGLEGVDFGSDGAKSVMMSIASATNDAAEGTISVYIDKIASNKKVGEITVNANKDYQYFKTKLTKTVIGKHKVFFKFSVKGILVDTWMFSKEEEPQEP